MDKEKNLNNLQLYFCYFLVGFFIYNMKITNELSNPDAIWNDAFYKKDWRWEASLGRFMISFLQSIRGNVVNTAVATIMCLLLLAGVCLCVVNIFRIEPLVYKLIIGALIIISPGIGSTLTYYYCSDLYCLSYFLAVIAVYIMIVGKMKRKLSILLACICLMLSMAIYQAYIVVAISLCHMYLCCMILQENSAPKKVIYKVYTFILGIGGGVVLYLASNRIIQLVLGIIPEENRGFSRMGEIDFSHLYIQICKCFQFFWDYYFSDQMINNFIHGRRLFNAVFFIFTFVLVVIILSGKLVISRKILFLFCLFCFPITVMSIVLFAPEISILDTTGALMLPAMNYVYLFVALVLRANKFTFRHFYKIMETGLLISICSVLYMLSILEFEGQSYMRYNMIKTEYVAGNMVNYIAADRDKKVCVIGCMEDGNYPEMYPELKESQHWLTPYYKTIWPDFGGAQACWRAYMKRYGLSYDVCSYEEYKQIIKTKEYTEMGNFPSKNSVRTINGIIVLKLSDIQW